MRIIQHFTFFFLLFSPLFAQPLQVKIVYPREGAKISAVTRSFVFGSVSPATATVRVNGSTVPVYKTGSYLALIPFQPGEFKIKVEAKINEKSTEAIRTVYVSSPLAALPAEPLKISTEGMRPAQDLELIAGDFIDLRFQGTPNCKAEYRFKNFKENNEWKPMEEQATAVPGIYKATYLIGSKDETEKAMVEFRLTHDSGRSVKAIAPGKLKILDNHKPLIVETNSEETVLRAGPSIGAEQMAYEIFLPKGVKLKSTGRIGNEVRIQLSETLSLWTDEKNISRIDTSYPRVILSSVKVQENPRSALVKLDLPEIVPYRISVSEDLKTVTLTIFYAISNLDRIPYAATAEMRVESITPSQIANETVEIKIKLKEKLWGYDLKYENKNLLWELIFAPKIKKGKLALAGITVAVDPGHSPKESDGAISPQGVTEGEVNYKTALCLKEKLEKSGAKVVLTRQEQEVVGLTERGKRAWKEKADIFISIHANALPDGANPWERSGFSIFYFQPQSLELAKKVHQSYQKTIGLADDGLYYGNLAVCRITQMPSLLTESAYLIRPDEEELLLSKTFQCKVAEALLNGLTAFLKQYE